MCASRFRMAPASKHTQKGAPAKDAWPRCCEGSGNSGNGSVISILQLRRYATCPSKHEITKSSSRVKDDVKGYLTRMSTKEHFQRVRVCILASKYPPLWLESLERFAQKRTIGCSPRCASYEKPSEGWQTSFFMSCKTELCAGWVLYSIYLLALQELRYCKPHSGRFLSPNICAKQRRFRMSVRVWLHSALWQSLLNLLLQVLCIGLPSSGGGKSDMHHTFTAFVRK